MPVRQELYDIQEKFQDIFWNGYINEAFKIYELRNMNSYIQRIYGVFDMMRVKVAYVKGKRLPLNEVYLGPQYFKDGIFIYSVKYDEEMKLYFRSHIRTMVSWHISNKQLLAYFFQLLEFVDNEEELKALMNNIYSSVVLKKEIIFKKIRNEKKAVLSYQFKSLCAATSFTKEEIDILKKLPYIKIFDEFPTKKVMLDENRIAYIPNFEDYTVFNQEIQKISDKYNLTYTLSRYLNVILPVVYYEGRSNTIDKISSKFYSEKTKIHAMDLMKRGNDELLLSHQKTLQALLNNTKQTFEIYTKEENDKANYNDLMNTIYSSIEVCYPKESSDTRKKFENFIRLLSDYINHYFKRSSKGDLNYFDKFVLAKNLNAPNKFNLKDNISSSVKQLYKINKIFQGLKEQESLKKQTPMLHSYLSDVNELLGMSNVQLYDFTLIEEIKDTLNMIFKEYENILFFYTKYTPSILTIKLEQAWEEFKQDALESNAKRQLEIIYNYLDNRDIGMNISIRQDVTLTEFYQFILKLFDLTKRITKMNINGEAERMKKIDDKYQYCKKKQ